MPEEQLRRKKAGLPDTARSASEIQLRLKDLLGEKVAKLEAFLSGVGSSSPQPPPPETKPLTSPPAQPQVQNGLHTDDEEDEAEEDDGEEEEEDEGDTYYDLGLERMAALMAALDLLKYEPLLRRKSVTVDFARRYSDAQFRELGLPLGVRVKLMEELKRLPL